MDTIRLATETLLRLLKTEIAPDAVLVAADDVFEAAQVPALLLQGPTLVEDARRRTPARWTLPDRETMTCVVGRYPRWYHLDFELVVSSSTERMLLELTGKIALLYQRVPVLAVPDLGDLPLTELTPLGGLRRVNLSNLRQASGRCRIEDCPVGDDTTLATGDGRLIGTPRIEMTLGGMA